MSSFTHESIVDEYKTGKIGQDLAKTTTKNTLSMMLLEKKRNELKEAKDNIIHTLYYSRRPIPINDDRDLEVELDNINAEIENIEEEMILLHDQETEHDELTNTIVPNTISTTKLASLPSFQRRNPPNTQKVLSDPYLFNEIIRYNTGFGGKRRTKKSTNKKSKSKKSKKSNSKRKVRKTKRTKTRRT